MRTIAEEVVGTPPDYDVVIMGGGLSGLLQARHLLRTIPGVRIAQVEPKSAEELAVIAKVGESTVEVAAHFMAVDLGLYDYLIENHLPKHGLNFHWARNLEQTDSFTDYRSMWGLRGPEIASFQLHRGRIERDLTRMNAELGVEQLRGHVVDFEINESGLHSVEYESVAGAERRRLRCRHLVDAAGRAFLLGKRLDNLVLGHKKLLGLKNGSAWMRIEGVDPEIFRKSADIFPAAASHYYGTNHWMGKGYWLWQIPICSETGTLSVGIMHHHDVVPAKGLRTPESFLEFLGREHRLLHRLCKSGQVVDFTYMGRPAHRSKTILSQDNWYVIGDAAYIYDAFYSLGSSTIAFTVTGVTETIRADLAGEPDTKEKREVLNEWQVWFSTALNHVVSRHQWHLGEVGVMSHRIYFETMWWFGCWIPCFMGRWHLEPDFIRRQLGSKEVAFHSRIYDEFDAIIERGGRLPFMDCYRADQLIGDYSPTRLLGPFLENTRYGTGELNIYRHIAALHFYGGIYWAKLQWASWGFRALFRRKVVWLFMAQMVKAVVAMLAAVQLAAQSRRKA